jgi:tetratricopeptide (TPR) repeat protein
VATLIYLPNVLFRGGSTLNRLRVVAVLLVLGVLAGCAGPGVRDLPPVIESGETRESPWPQEELPPVSPPQEQAPETPPAMPNSAVTSLINQSRSLYNSHDYSAAIAAAERGLRIDRRAPELYLVIAQSYVQLGQSAQAEQFVQQGLRYAQPGSPVSESLQRVRRILRGGDF